MPKKILKKGNKKDSKELEEKKKLPGKTGKKEVLQNESEETFNELTDDIIDPDVIEEGMLEDDINPYHDKYEE